MLSCEKNKQKIMHDKQKDGFFIKTLKHGLLLVTILGLILDIKSRQLAIIRLLFLST